MTNIEEFEYLQRTIKDLGQLMTNEKNWKEKENLRKELKTRNEKFQELLKLNPNLKSLIKIEIKQEIKQKMKLSQTQIFAINIMNTQREIEKFNNEIPISYIGDYYNSLIVERIFNQLDKKR